MIIAGAIGLALGALLSRRFSVFALLPAIIIVAAVTFAIGVGGGDSFEEGVWLAVTIAVALQAGYLAGLFLNGLVGRRAGVLWRFARGRSRGSKNAAYSRRSRLR